MSTNDRLIKLEGVSVDQIELLDDKVLVRVLPREQVRASGLLVLEGAPEHQVGAEFYGEVVKVGPGTLVQDGPTPEDVADAVEFAMRHAMTTIITDETMQTFVRQVVADVQNFCESKKALRRVPPPWKPGDQVLVKQGFGVEIDFREGRHHVVERAGQYGHGILAAWDPEHKHCWHSHRGAPGSAHCACGAIRTDLETRLPACTNCPPGERLAEAVLGGKHVYDVKIPDAPKVQPSDPEDPSTFRVGEMRPE